MSRINLSVNPTRSQVAELHGALAKLGFRIAHEELRRGVISDTTRTAVRSLQSRAGLEPDGNLNAATTKALESALDHAFYTRSKTRTAKLHVMLARVGLQLDAEEVAAHRFGASTTKAIADFQRRADLRVTVHVDGELVARLESAALRARLQSKTQVGKLQRKLLHAARIAKVDGRIDAAELREKRVGPTTTALIEAFQKKYRLPGTGIPDVQTVERLESVAVSRRRVTKPAAAKVAGPLARVASNVRLNMTGAPVERLHRGLARLGFGVDATEVAAREFGRSTREAVLAFERRSSLPLTGHVAGATRKRLDAAITALDPVAAGVPHRVRGAIRDELWRGRSGLRVQVVERTLGGEGRVLAERRTTGTGFFDVPYTPPRGTNGDAHHLSVRVLDEAGTVLETRDLFNPTTIAWSNFTSGAAPYRGTSELEQRMTAVTRVLGARSIETIEESAAKQEVSYVAQHTQLAVEDVMRLVLAHRCAARIADPAISPPVAYAFVRQNQPPGLPSDLLLATERWTLIAALVEQTAEGIVFMEEALHAATFDAAAKANLIPIATQRARTQVLAALAARRRTFALERPILVGNGTLAAVLAATTLPVSTHANVADAFLRHRSLGKAFWEEVATRPADFGGDAAIRDLQRTSQIAHIAKHHTPTFTFLKSAVGSAARPQLQTVGDLAALDHAGWVALINENGGAVPAGTDGATPAERIDVYAATLAAQAEQMFPAIALTSRLAGSGSHGLTHVGEVRAFFATRPDVDLAQTNLDKLVRDGATVAPEVLAEAKLVQRVHRLAPAATVARALLDEKIHMSSSVVALGQRRFVEKLEARGVVRRDALTLFGRAELQYAAALGLLTSFRAELFREHPAVIIPHTYTPEEQQSLLGTIPNLETLFGSMDACNCEHCQSLYGPAAYLADVLRFLDSHPSEVSGQSVREVLFGRRPDLGNLKLDCDNTNTALPYVDLVCELLEAAIAPTQIDAAFGFQTTGTTAELRAFPANVRKHAYDTLRSAEVPMDVAFDLWQEDARTHLDHLGVPRHALMTAFQQRTATPAPSDASIAAEKLGISSHELRLLTSTSDATAPRQQALWGFDATRTQVPVRDLLDRAHLEYGPLLELVQAKWLSPGGTPLAIERPDNTCDLTRQRVVQLSIERFDRVHRFTRLWRRTGWKVWELDLLVRAARIGGGAITADTITRLADFRAVAQALNLSVESALALYEPINTEVRIDPQHPDRTIQPLYANLFQNRTLTNPIDPGLAMPFAGGDTLAQHAPALVAAFAITRADLDRLIARTDGALTLDNLTRLYRGAIIARSTGLGIERWLTLVSLGIPDPWTSPRATLDLLDTIAAIRRSGLEMAELDYLLAHRPDSPYGLRTETIDGYLATLVDALRGAAASEIEGRVVSHVATTFGVRDEQARLLLERLQMTTPLLARFVAVAGGVTTGIHDCYRLLHEVTLLMARHKLADRDDLEWLLVSGPAFGILDFSTLPVAASPAASLLSRWLVLVQWLAFRARFPEAEGISFRHVLDLARASAPVADLRTAVQQLTGWAVADQEAITTGLGLTPTDFTVVDTWQRLATCFDQIKRIGVAPPQVLAWVDRDGIGDAQFQAAQQIRQAAKSKYDDAAWLGIATPLQDVLREKKRDALIRHHVEQAQRTQPVTVTVGGRQWANPRHFRDANALLTYYLIDVEMCACQLTSRLKQAMSSVQMFVQRCFLNLEQPAVRVSEEEREDVVSLDSWRQWRYMRSYRLWEANRKVFLYPENWIEPELRDDKTPFFEELEAELLQSDLTAEDAEMALRHYLEKLHEVSHLEVVGASQQVDDEDADDDLEARKLLHVVARTRQEPAVYYYRQFDFNYNRWTAWEKIDADITGSHVVPVVYNRQLYLFWLSFMEKPQKVKKQPAAQPSTTPTNSPDAPKLLEIQLAWSQRKGDGWTPKTISRQKLVHPWERPESAYHLKPRYKSRENHLWLDLYVSTAEPFNDRRFYDPVQGAFAYLTATRFDETLRPWHASSFVFDGRVVDVRMKALTGYYRLPAGDGTIADTPTLTTSLEYVRRVFGDGARWLNQLNGPYEIAPRLLLPDGMHFEGNRLANNKARPNRTKLATLELGVSRLLLDGAQAPFEMVAPLDQIQVDAMRFGETPAFYQDRQRAFFIRPHVEQVEVGYNRVVQRTRYEFSSFSHPYSALFLRELGRDGVSGLYARRLQRFPHTYFPANNFRFSSTYRPAAPHAADAESERETIDFSQHGALSTYNWELFFHIPLLIACRLSQNQRFQEAMEWFHTIFDPTNVEALEAPQRFWITKPFFDQNAESYRAQRIESLLANLGVNIDQIRAWKNDPFKPHLIARYRPVAYQKAVVMKYVDNLIAWGDQLFGRDTIESINEATTLYVLAYELLGRRPERVPHVARTALSYNELLARTTNGTGAMAVFESHAGAPDAPGAHTRTGEQLPVFDISYFGIPSNDKLLEYWDRVEDRLFKIRHCMNLQGVVRQLPLFEPPIDPGLLVKAAAAGVDLGSVLDEVDLATGPYRYRTMVAKSVELCNDVRVLGDRLRLALEQRDAEGLGLLRASQEIAVLSAVRDIRKLQVSEAQATRDSLERAKLVSENKRDYYTTREFTNSWETTSLVLSSGTAVIEAALAVVHLLAAGLRVVPPVNVGASGFGGSPHATAEVVSGDRLGNSTDDGSKAARAAIGAIDKTAAITATVGSYMRRQDDWNFYAEQARREIAQVDKQILAAEIRQAVAEHELETIELQIENAKAIDEYARTKYTNQQLYAWMIQQLSTVYFQSYKLAYDMARRAEKAWQFELGRTDSFIQFGYWDSLKKGLLAADRLSVDLRRMEAAWLEHNTRTFEITKHVSLAQIAPLELLRLRENGACDITLPEWLFDMDYPGHYRRRLRSVSLSIPSVVGPYASISCTLSLVNNGIRISESTAGGYGDPLTTSDTRFQRAAVSASSIATSHGREDTGMFELRFDDERYLPFEGAGAVSTWHLELPRESNAFDLSTVSDVVIHVRYTAVRGGPGLETAARANLAAMLPSSGVQLVGLRNELGDAWHRFLFPTSGPQTFALQIGPQHLPFHARAAGTIRLQRVDLLIDSPHAGALDVVLDVPGSPGTATPAARDATFGGMHHFSRTITGPVDARGAWSLQIKKDSAPAFDALAPEDLQNAWLVMAFTTS